jgi:dihydropteroate synthase
MGIVNVTPDSFYPASRATNAAEALARGREMFAAGCDLVDVGGESTRPGADAVDEAEELRRVLPVVEGLAGHGTVSVDTQKADVARAALRAGARVVNDVSATLMEVAAELGAGYVAMHRQGDAASMQRDPHYVDVVAEVRDFLVAAGERARAAGVTRLWLDPGIGFGKSVEHNLSLLAHLDELVAAAHALDAEVLVGTSRKSFLGRLGTELGVDERLEGSLATAAWAWLSGAEVVRVHDVEETLMVRDLLARPLAEVGA